MIEKKESKQYCTSFTEVMGDNAYIRILDFLIENERDSWTLKEINEGSELGYSTIKKIMPKLLQNELVKIAKTVGKSNLYEVNKENKMTKMLIKLHDIISNELAMKTYIK